MPRVSVVIPTWNGGALLADSLASLERQRFGDFDVIVVDNGSTDGTLERLGPRHPGVKWIRFEENRGFAAAANAGIRAAEGEIVVLMSNDVEADPDWLLALVSALDAHPEAASCASKMLVHADPSRIDSAGVQLGVFASQIGHGESDAPPYDKPRYVFAPCAGAAAYRRTALDEVGLFDERFFAYFEDVDLGVRLQLAGYRCLYVPGAVVRHRVSATAARVPSMKFYLLMRNALFLFFQTMPVGRMLLWAPLVIAWPFVRSRLDHQPLRLAARVVLDFLRDLPAVVASRRRNERLRRISRADFRARLEHPLTRQRHSIRPGVLVPTESTAPAGQ